MKMNPSLLVAALAVLLLALASAVSGGAFSFCRPMSEPAAEECEHGFERDMCGRTVCAKGPGELCGGPSHIHGKCGDGMHCKCERCIGCSLHTFTCYDGSAVCL